MAWMARLDARATHWSPVARGVYVCVKWTLVALGAYLLIGWHVLTWGWAAALWFLGAPLIYGFLRGRQGATEEDL